MSDQRTGQWWENRRVPTVGPGAAGGRRGRTADSVAGQFAVGHRVGAGGLGTEPGDLVLLVRVELALEPEPPRRVLGLALPDEDGRGDPVDEPPVVGAAHIA